MFKQFIKDAQKKAKDFLEKPETKEALDKLKSEYTELSKKASKLLDEGDEILKKKVDEVLNKKQTENTQEETVNTETEVVVEDTVETEVVVKEEPVVETKVEEPVFEAPVTVKSSEVKISQIGLSEKVTNLLIDDGVETFDQLEDMSDEEILALNGIGAATLKKIRAFKV